MFYFYLVVDVYTEWCGPCIPMIANLKKIKLELGGETLHYAIVNILSVFFNIIIVICSDVGTIEVIQAIKRYYNIMFCG